MNDQKLLGATLMGSLAIATIGAPGKMPSPSRYTGIFALWFVLGILAQFGPQAARFASALSGLVLLTLGMGAAGIRVIGWVNSFGARFAAQPATSSSPQSSPGGGGIAGAGSVIQAAGLLTARPR